MGQYIVLSPGYLGPNALPVPEIKTGRMEEDLTATVGGDLHYSKGDDTKNLSTKIHIPFGSKMISLDLWGVPTEYYKMSNETRDERLARDSIGKGFSTGDFYFGTQIVVLKETKRRLGFLVNLVARTASGNNMGNARFTDSPGYYFDGSFGKSFLVNNRFFSELRFFGMGGFYVWQTNDVRSRQDDAFLFGGGAEVYAGSFKLNTALGGYSGYQKNKDRPLVYRAILTKKTLKTDFIFSYQVGLRDFKYNTFSFAISRHFRSKK